MPYAAGTCRGCGVPAATRCDACKAARREEEAQRRAERKAAGLCRVCAAPVAKTKLINASAKRVREPAAYCREHLAYYAARSRSA